MKDLILIYGEEAEMADPTPTCDLCGEEWEDGGEGEDWNGETGNHVSCELQALTREAEIDPYDCPG